MPGSIVKSKRQFRGAAQQFPGTGADQFCLIAIAPEHADRLSARQPGSLHTPRAISNHHHASIGLGGANLLQQFMLFSPETAAKDILEMLGQVEMLNHAMGDILAFGRGHIQAETVAGQPAQGTHDSVIQAILAIAVAVVGIPVRRDGGLNMIRRGIAQQFQVDLIQ